MQRLVPCMDKIRAAINSPRATVAYFLLAALTVTLSIEQYVIPLWILWLLFVLLIEKNFLSIFFPMLLLNAFALRTAGHDLALMRHVWLIVPVLAAISLHFVIHYRKFVRGRQFWSHVALSVALVLGGAFSISAKEYFSADALYYVGLLGPGMLFFYLWFRNSLEDAGAYDIKEKLMESLYGLGFFCFYSIVDQAIRNLLAHGTVNVPYIWGNDISVLMLFAIPAALYYARGRYAHLISAFLFVAVLPLTRSYAGILVGCGMLVLSLGYLAFYRKKTRALTLSLLGGLCLAGIAAFVFLCVRAGGLSALFRAEENGRLSLLAEAWRNFCASPVFGAGLGEKGDAEVHFLAIKWTHNYLMQIVGSLGLVGVAAYGYQMYLRARLALAKRDAFTVAATLTYLSLFFVSMLQPGEFCPMPYATMAVMIFTVLEINAEKEKNATPS